MRPPGRRCRFIDEARSRDRLTHGDSITWLSDHPAIHQGRTRIVSLTQYYTATTLNGFIADPDNSLEWLFTRKREDDGPLNYGEFIAGIGAIAMGSAHPTEAVLPRMPMS